MGVVEALTVPNTGLVKGETLSLTLNSSHLPLQDTNGDSAFSSGDITLGISTRTVLPLITSIGRIAISDPDTGLATGDLTLRHSGDDLAAGSTITVSYLGLEDLVTVKGAGAGSIPVRLRETGVDTGMYEATIIAIGGDTNVIDPAGNLNPTLSTVNIATADATGVARGNTVGFPLFAVIDNGFVTVKYNDRKPVTAVTARVRVEDDGPVFSNESPADGSSTNDTNSLLVVEVTDLTAGVDPATGTSVNVIFGTSVGGIISSGGNLEDGSGNIVTRGSTNITTTGGGMASIISETFAGSGIYRIGYSIAKVPDVAAAVAAGTEISQLTIAWQVTVRDKAGNVATSSARTLTVDNTTPVLQSAFAGDNWDSTNARVASSDPGRKFGSDSRTSIRVQFDGPMQGSSFQASDFLVVGVAPTAVAHFAGSADSVFLTVAEMASNATPTVEIVGSVTDDGGNALSTGSVTAADDIAPDVTVTFDDGLSYTSGAIKLRVLSDEALATALPFVDIRSCNSNIACTGSASFTSTPRIVTENREFTFDLSVTSIGVHGILVRGVDSESNQGIHGVASATDATRVGDPGTSGAILFGIDASIPAPTTWPVDDASRSEADPFVYEIVWTAEGTEYTGDTHSAVTLTKAVLDACTASERDVLALHSSRDNKTFSIAITNPAISLGAHTITFNGKDELGNTLASDVVNDFTVVEPPKFTLNLNPGLNLVSIPRDPADGSVGSVFGAIT